MEIVKIRSDINDVDITDLFSSDPDECTRISSEVTRVSSKGNYMPQMTFGKSSAPVAAKISHQ
jgi:hypothetical protein